ncbi:MAG: nicotinate (nicotinamide) nucleotide adenylyltransferase [Pseudomonadales bacterium]|nr:nicotinate (nicotinamide) nucleotide adenylyltransferase [Pseudomonadales bacterium]
MTVDKKPKLIAVFGGTFDPFHLGHKAMLEGIRHCLDPDLLLLIPCAEPAHRSRPSASAEHRLAMARLAIQGYEKVLVDDCELNRQKQSFTIDTLMYLRNQYGDEVSIVFCVGKDAFDGLDSWYRCEDILRYTHIAVLPREVDRGDDKIASTGLPQCCKAASWCEPSRLSILPFGQLTRLDIPLYPVSSTTVRKEIRKHSGNVLHTALEGMLPAAVIEYIDQHGLYIDT